MLAMHCQDLVLNQHHPPLDSTCHFTQPLGGKGAVTCQGHIPVLQWALEMGKGWFLSQFLMRSLVDFVFTAPFTRLGGQILLFWHLVPNSLVNPPCISAQEL